MIQPDLTLLFVPVYSPLCNLAFALRREVFIEEQRVEDDEFDDLDRAATHLVAIDAGDVVGTLRLLVDGNTMKIGRVAVRRSRRGEGIGARLLQAALDHGRQAGFLGFRLAAQHDKTGFYARFGFTVSSAPYDDGSGILHVDMLCPAGANDDNS